MSESEDKLENKIIEDFKPIFEKYLNVKKYNMSIGTIIGIMYSAFFKVIMLEHNKRFSDHIETDFHKHLIDEMDISMKK